MKLFWSFMFCGTICLIAQIILDNTKLTPGHITSIFVVSGALLDTFNVYDFFVKHVGGGAMLPITSFGHSLVHGAIKGSTKKGILGLLLGVFDLTTPGIVAAIFFSFVFTLLFRAKD